MSSKIILKKSSIAAKAPVVGDIDFGELALNYNDGKLYYKKSDNSIDFFSSGQLVGGGANVTTSDTAPLSPLDGDLWWDSQTAALKIYYNDGSSTQWVDISTGGGGGATYSVSATSNIGGAYITLSGSDSSTDNLLIASGSNTTVSQTDADTITIDVDLSSREPLISKSTGYAKWNGSAWIFVNDTYLTGTKVDSFNTRTGAITLTSADVTTALTYTPYNATNPSGYTNNTGTVTSVGGTGTVSGLTLTGSVTTTGNLTLGGAITGFATTAHNHSLDSLTNTTITANSSGEILKWNGTAWINNTLAEAGIATPSDISSAISGLVNGADAAYDTLKEIQDAMATDAELAAAISGLTIGNGIQTITAGTYLTGGGTFTANQTGDSSVTLTVDATSANTASKVVARDISGNFSAGTITAALSGNATSATSATQWTTGRTVAMTGDVTYTSSSLNGTANVTGTATLATVATPGTYSSVTVDAKGRVTTGTNPGYLTGTKVDSFNTRTGAVTLTSADVTTALTYTPYNATNPSGYTTNTGTVISVDTANGTGISVTGGPITTSGTLTITNTAPNVTTNITTTHAASTVTVNSSDGTNGTINAATTSLAGVLTGTDKTKLDGIAAGAQVNVATDLGYTTAASTGTVTSSTGTNTTLPAATTTLAGLLTGTDKTKLDGIAAGAQVNVATNLGYTTAASTGTVTSSTGTSTTLPAATTTLAGLLTGSDKTKLDGLVIGTTVQAYSTNLSSWASIATSTKQDTLVSATNIKTVNSTSILGSGNIAVQPTLVSGTNIKTINGTTLLGSGDLVISGATYNISSETSTGGALLRLSGSDLSTDDIKFAAGTDITVVRTDANTITINSTAAGATGPQGPTGPQGDTYLTASSTSLTVGTGSKTLTVATGLAYSVSQSVRILYIANTYMDGLVTSYNSNTGELIVDVGVVAGSGTYNSWTVNLSSPLTTVSILDDISGSFNGVTTTFALTEGAAPVFPELGRLIVSLGGIIQRPDSLGNTGFNVASSNIVFAEAPKAGYTFFAYYIKQISSSSTGTTAEFATAMAVAFGF